MSKQRAPSYDEEDLFAHTRMSLGDHIEELRMALWKALKGFFVAMIFAFFIADSAVHFIARPIERQLEKHRQIRLQQKKEELMSGDPELVAKNEPQPITMSFDPRQLAATMGVPTEGLPQGEKEIVVMIKPLDFAFQVGGQMAELTRPASLTALSVTEVFMVWMKVAIYLGFVIGSPWIFYHIWMFIAAGLYPHEKKLVHWYLPFSILLFLAGAALCQFVVLPIAIDYLLSFNRWLNIEPDLRLSEWLSFAILLPVMFGLSFQTPMLMFFLYKLNFVEVDIYQKYRKVAIFIMFVIAALLVTGDPFSLFGLAVPLVLLYELGIIMCKLSPRQIFDLDVEESEEMVEV